MTCRCAHILYNIYIGTIGWYTYGIPRYMARPQWYIHTLTIFTVLFTLQRNDIVCNVICYVYK